jgi:hypothetical protein
VANDDVRRHSASEAARTPKALDAARVWEQRAPCGTKSRKHVPTSHEGDAYPCDLDDVAAIRDIGFEHATSNFERPEREAVHDPAGSADEDDHADSHEHCDRRSPRCLRREQHERWMIAGARMGRHDRRDCDLRHRACSEHEVARPEAQPCSGLPLGQDDRLAATVECEPGSAHVDRGRGAARVPDRDRATRRPGKPQAHRRHRERRRCNAGRSHDHRPITVKVSVAV